MANRVFSMGPEQQYLKDSTNPDNIAKYFQAASKRPSLPSFGKTDAAKARDHDPLPSFLKVWNKDHWLT